MASGNAGLDSHDPGRSAEPGKTFTIAPHRIDAARSPEAPECYYRVVRFRAVQTLRNPLARPSLTTWGVRAKRATRSA